MEYYSKTILLKLTRTWIILWVLFLGVATSDVDKDKEECANEVTELAKCLPYVSGEAKSPPTRDCCTGLDQVVHKNLRCICLLVRDRNDPGLGLKINATILALSLPALCQVPANVSQCASLLNLPPGSADAKLFDDLANNGTEGSMAAARARPRIGSNSAAGSGGGFLRPEINVVWLSLAAAAAAMVDHL